MLQEWEVREGERESGQAAWRPSGLHWTLRAPGTVLHTLVSLITRHKVGTTGWGYRVGNTQPKFRQLASAGFI